MCPLKKNGHVKKKSTDFTCYISCDGSVWVCALRIHTVEITGLLMTNLAAQQDDEFVPFHPHLPLLLPPFLVNELWLRSLHFDWHLASSKSGCDHDVLWSSCLFFVRSHQLFQFLCTVTFRIYRLVHYCLPNNMKEEAFLLTIGACFTSAFYCPVLSFSLTPTYSGLRSCSERLAEQMNNSTLLSWVESDYSSCSVSASFFSIFQPLARY